MSWLPVPRSPDTVQVSMISASARGKAAPCAPAADPPSCTTQPPISQSQCWQPLANAPATAHPVAGRRASAALAVRREHAAGDRRRATRRRSPAPRSPAGSALSRPLVAPIIAHQPVEPSARDELLEHARAASPARPPRRRARAARTAGRRRSAPASGPGRAAVAGRARCARPAPGRRARARVPPRSPSTGRRSELHGDLWPGCGHGSRADYSARMRGASRAARDATRRAVVGTAVA